jgi:hypothetical protein
VDQRAWRIALTAGPENNLSFAGIEVANDIEPERMARNLADRDIAVETDDDTLAAERGVTQLEFYHCNPRHHTLALSPIKADRRTRHFLLQAESFDDVGFALDGAQASGAKVSATLDRHTNDHMISFYALTPAGFEVEYGFGARTVDGETWVDALYHRPSNSGDKRL